MIRGVRQIKRGMIKKENNEEWVIQTEGTNFVDVIKIEGVDSNTDLFKSYSRNRKELSIKPLGKSLIRETIQVLHNQSLDVNIRNSNCMADLMTSSGSIQQIGRHGISGTKESVLARAASKITIKQLLQASIAGEEKIT